MPEALPLSSLQQLQRLLGLPAWHLRRHVAERATLPPVPEPAPPASLRVQTPPAPASTGAGQPATSTDAAALVLHVDGYSVHISRELTVLAIRGYGSWWLPALSQADGTMRLFRSEAEMAMLRALLDSVGLAALAAHLQDIDAFLASQPMPANRPPANPADLLSLPAPWLLCGAMAQKQAENVAAAQESLPLPHPLLLLKQPQHKRLAWQHILAYKKKVHD